MFEEENLCNGWVKKDGVNANLVFCDWPNFRYPIDFGFSLRLTSLRQNCWCVFGLFWASNVSNTCESCELSLRVQCKRTFDASKMFQSLDLRIVPKCCHLKFHVFEVMFKVSFTTDLKAPECKASAWISVTTEVLFYKMSQFLGN